MRRFHVRLAAITAGITLAVLLMTAGLFFLLPGTGRAAFVRFPNGITFPVFKPDHAGSDRRVEESSPRL